MTTVYLDHLFEHGERAHEHLVVGVDIGIDVDDKRFTSLGVATNTKHIVNSALVVCVQSATDVVIGDLREFLLHALLVLAVDRCLASTLRAPRLVAHEVRAGHLPYFKVVHVMTLGARDLDETAIERDLSARNHKTHVVTPLGVVLFSALRSLDRGQVDLVEELSTADSGEQAKSYRSCPLF